MLKESPSHKTRTPSSEMDMASNLGSCVQPQKLKLKEADNPLKKYFPSLCLTSYSVTNSTELQKPQSPFDVLDWIAPVEYKDEVQYCLRKQSDAKKYLDK